MSSKDVLDSRSLAAFLSSMAGIMNKGDKIEVIVYSKDIESCPEIAMNHDFAIVDGDEIGENKVKLVLEFKGR
ncbi:hypothetical protein [Sulfuracidifex metallicus]|uniref:hypothetical protein n=1 Tax=Sulfuracidifex metallicus TaxID=47303 RepID=UPI00227529E9|nr:hypothetical protein [Sulfuracidifex metallicus]MCY0850300.1 hypothetical protein [Sulfuracidifex metallicus]